MRNQLIVPIQCEALFLIKAAPVRESFADFTRLPYSDGQQDFNPDVAYLSEEILTPPFQDENLMLPAGMHLHWYLPGILTKNQSIGVQNNMPAVPDRWLITRYRQNNAERNWLVESDFITEEANDNGMVRCHVPYYNGNPRSRNKPFRFLGRVTELDNNWHQQQTLAGERIQHLTATGYLPQAGTTGYDEPTFAAFYPHCSSVFGFYDKDITAVFAADGLAYQVLGFYSRPGNDYLAQYIGWFMQQQSGQSLSVRKFNERLYIALSEEFQWKFDFTADQIPDGPAQTSFTLADVWLPTQSFFSSRIEFTLKMAEITDASYRIAVGNTGTEALSAFLASESDNNDKVLIENQLEALQFTSRLSNRNLDTGAKFREARHEKGFASLPGETHWTIVLRSAGSAETDTKEEIIAESIVPAEDLHRINTLQQLFERAQLDLEMDQRHLFADWNKYMLCAYPPPDNRDAFPDIDEAKTFIEQNHIGPILQTKETIGELQVQQNEQGDLLHAVALPEGVDSIAARLAAQMNKVLAQVNSANTHPDLAKSNKKYTLKPVSGPRYWRPNDPVILLARKGASDNGIPVGMRNPIATLSCFLFGPESAVTPGNLDTSTLLFLQKNAYYLYQKRLLQVIRWNGNPWQPFLLEWEAEIFPASTNSNLQTKERIYTTDFITANYQLDETETDFRPLETYATTDEGQTLYSGMSILTPNASIRLGSDVKAYLIQWIKTDLPDRYFQSTNVQTDNRNDQYLTENIASFNAWVNALIQNLTPFPPAGSENFSAELDDWWAENITAISGWYLSLSKEAPSAVLLNFMKSYRQLQGWQCLAQSMGGFNEALLMRKQTRQLEIADPIGFPEYQDFTDRIREAINGKSNTAPQPLNDFIPLRTGHMKICSLRLVDNFGQTVDIGGLEQGAITSEPLRDAVHADKILFRPRLSQAARLNLRWLSARQGLKETNAHPGTSPICGWLLPNYLDNSIAFYDENGQALGSLTPNPDAPWQSAPGNPFASTIAQIENIHMERVVQYLYNQQVASFSGSSTQTSFLEQFIDVLESALETIHPENFSQHADLALLMGRPVAVVRVSLDLQLLGRPAEHQGWNTFIKELQGAQSETDDFERVEFPVRLGERRQLNDGLIGYWPESADGLIGKTFYSPVASPVAYPGIVTYKQGGPPLNVSLNINASAQSYTLLMDPRGKLHATSGILPTKVIDIPPLQYTQALRNIEVTFQVTPLLSDKGKTKISLPVEPGYAWSWLEQTGPVLWREISQSPEITQEIFREKMPNPADLWDKLVSIGWLLPSANRPGTAIVTPKDQRKPVTDPMLTKELLDNADRVFDAYAQYLQPMDATLSFATAQEIREGWLKLSAAPAQAQVT